MSGLLTLKQIAGVIGIPESSLRKYREIFEDFIPGVGSGRGRRYHNEAVEVFREIRAWREDENMPWEAITSKLAEKYPINTETVRVTPEDVPVRPAASYSPRPAPQEQLPHPMPIVAASDPEYTMALRRIKALNERQLAVINALATEMLRFIERQQSDGTASQAAMTKEIRAMSESMGVAVQRLNASVADNVRKQGEYVAGIYQRLAALEANYNELVKGGVQSIRVDEVKEKILSMRKKIEERDKVIEEFKNSFEVLKRENSELRAFKGRHVDKAEEKIREMKAYRKTPFWMRITGTKV